MPNQTTQKASRSDRTNAYPIDRAATVRQGNWRTAQDEHANTHFLPLVISVISIMATLLIGFVSVFFSETLSVLISALTRLLSGFYVGLATVLIFSVGLLLYSFIRLLSSKRATEESRKRLLGAAQSLLMTAAQARDAESIAIVDAYPSERLEELQRSLRPSAMTFPRLVVDLENFHPLLGDDTAATFPYIVDPVNEAFELAKRALRHSEVTRGKGILIVGSAHSGKTRLAMMALLEAALDRSLVYWNPSFVLPGRKAIEALVSKRVALLIDDLHRAIPVYSATEQVYISARAGVAADLRHEIESVKQRALSAVVIATCQEDSVDLIRREMSWLVQDLQVIRILPITKGVQQRWVKDEFSKFGASSLSDWDGTLGSLVLNLGAKHETYKRLAQGGSPAAQALRAMKILRTFGIHLHSEERIRAICGASLGERDIAAFDNVWQHALETLTNLNYVAYVKDTHGTRQIIISHDSYFDEVISDLDPSEIIKKYSESVEQTLLSIGDADGLRAMGLTHLVSADYVRAASIYRNVLALRTDDSKAWLGFYTALNRLGQSDKAVEAYHRWQELIPSDEKGWYLNAPI